MASRNMSFSADDVRSVAMPETRGRYFTTEVSEAIRVARVVCITLMMVVHVWPGATTIIAADVPAAIHAVYVILINEFGRASVPLLSIVSGLLFFRSLSGKTWLALIVGKIRTLLIPMAAWSAVLLSMYVARALYAGDTAFFNVSTVTWINRVFGVFDAPINIPMGFLRDIFVSCVIALGAFQLDLRVNRMGLALIAAIAVVEYSVGGYVLLRPQVLLFFALGVAIAQLSPRSLVIPWFIVVVAAATDALIQFGPINLTSEWREPAALFHRIAVATLMWRICLAIVRQHGWFSRTVFSLEPLIFLVFCSHMITISVLAVVFGALQLTVESPFYPIVFALQIPVVFLAAVVIQAIGSATAPGLLDFMTGAKRKRRAIRQRSGSEPLPKASREVPTS